MVLDELYGHLTIDGVDALDAYGLVVLRGSAATWLQFPEMKDVFSHSWSDENGLEVDLANRYMKERSVSLTCLFVADSAVQFWTNYNDCLAALSAPGIRVFYYRELDKDFEVYYVKATGSKLPMGRLNTGQLYWEQTLSFVMPDPSAIVERLVAPTAISVSVGDVYGSESFTYQVSPSTASQNIRATVTAGTGNAYVAGNMIYATEPGTVTLRVTSALDSSVYAEVTINVYPSNIIGFANNDMLGDGAGNYMVSK